MILDFAVITVVNGDLALTLFGGVKTTDLRLSNARPPLPHIHEQSDVFNLAGDLAACEQRTNKGVVSGYAGLDGGSKLDGRWQVYGQSANTAVEGNDPRLVSPDRILTDFHGNVLTDAKGNVLWK
jgi:hypothetical protein